MQSEAKILAADVMTAASLSADPSGHGLIAGGEVGGSDPDFLLALQLQQSEERLEEERQRTRPVAGNNRLVQDPGAVHAGLRMSATEMPFPRGEESRGGLGVGVAIPAIAENCTEYPSSFSLPARIHVLPSEAPPGNHYSDERARSLHVLQLAAEEERRRLQEDADHAHALMLQQEEDLLAEREEERRRLAQHQHQSQQQHVGSDGGRRGSFQENSGRGNSTDARSDSKASKSSKCVVQ